MRQDERVDFDLTNGQAFDVTRPDEYQGAANRALTLMRTITFFALVPIFLATMVVALIQGSIVGAVVCGIFAASSLLTGAYWLRAFRRSRLTAEQKHPD
jgi:uncharacterized protein YqhQ